MSLNPKQVALINVNLINGTSRIEFTGLDFVKTLAFRLRRRLGLVGSWKANHCGFLGRKELSWFLFMAEENFQLRSLLSLVKACFADKKFANSDAPNLQTIKIITAERT